MNREDIIRMAREANIKQAIETPHLLMVHELERFAALVAKHEREACAKAVEDYCGAWDDKGYALATAIRARGDKE
jgi:hypothetical protein